MTHNESIPLLIAWLSLALCMSILGCPPVAHAQAITFRAASSSGSAVTPTAFLGAGAAVSGVGVLNPAYPAGWTPGDILICIVESRDNTAPTMPVGWTLLNSASRGSNHRASLFWRKAQAGDVTTPAVNHGADTAAAAILGFSGIDSASNFDVANSFTASNSDLITEAAGITTVTANALLVFTAHLADDYTSLAIPAGSAPWTSGLFYSNPGSGGLAIGAYYGLRPAAGAQAAVSATRTGAAAAVSHGALLALRPSLSINKPAGTVQNDVLVASIAARPHTVTITPPAGWVLVRRTDNVNGDSNTLAVYRKLAGAAEPTHYTWVISASTGAAGGIQAFANVDPVNPILIEDGASTASGTSHATPSVTTGLANAMIVASFGYGSARDWAPPAGMNEAFDRRSQDVSSTGITVSAHYASQPAAGASGIKTAIASADADDGNAHILALRPLAGVHHFAFAIAGGAAASTCTPKTITIAAQDASNVALTNYTGTINLTTSASHGTWTLVTGAGTLTPGAADSGAATYTFAPADNGVVVLALSDKHADDLTVTAVDNTQVATSSTSAVINYRGNAFVITATDALGTVPVAGRAHAMRVEMKQDPTGVNCGVETSYTGVKTLDAWITRDVSDPLAAAPTIGALTLPAAAPASNPATNNLTLTFVNGVATFNLATTAVGKYTINLRDDTRTYAQAVDFSAASPTLTVKPFGLAIRNIVQTAAPNTTNPAGTATAGAKFIPAGNTAQASARFTATITAYLWQAADDANNDGVPDAGANITNNGVAAGFAWATTLSPSGTAPFFTPATGILGTLTGTLTLAQASFAASQATVSDLAYSEVGSFQMLANASNYLNTAGVSVSGVSVTAAGAATTIGRFYPDHFTLASGSVTPACASGGFTYMDQAALGVNYVVQARNTAAATTSNYGLGYAVGTVSLIAENNDSGVNLSARLTVPVSAWSAGTYTVNTSTAGFARAAAPDGPFDNLQLGVQVTDPDGVVLTLRNMDPGTSGVCGVGCTGVVVGATTKVRLGRLRLSNANGSPLIAMPIPVHAQYWNGAGFIQNTLDSCTTFAIANVALGNYQRNLNAGETIVSGGGAFNAGVGTLRLSAPGAGNNGSVDVSVNVSSVPAGASCTPGMSLSAAANKTHLQGAWCGAALTRDPSARATFGVYRGSDQLIYQRENF
ncbi:MAG: DUF6701 domain-containing protein [Pseudomonadota bacterium]